MNIESTREKIRDIMDELDEYMDRDELNEYDISNLSEIKYKIMQIKNEINIAIEQNQSESEVQELNREIERITVPLENISYLISRSTIILADNSTENIDEKEITEDIINDAKEKIEKRKQVKSPIEAVMISNVSADNLMKKISDSLN